MASAKKVGYGIFGLATVFFGILIIASFYKGGEGFQDADAIAEEKRRFQESLNKVTTQVNQMDQDMAGGY